jgi:hypothetical protein
MKLTWLITNPVLASVRLRASVPAEYLLRWGFGYGNDILIASKHGWKWSDVSGQYGKIVMDVCDDHFEDQHADHYKEACEKADAVTCNSPVMADIILHHTGRKAKVIDDPYEEAEAPPECPDGGAVLWFGHKSNLPQLFDAMTRGDVGTHLVKIVSNQKGTIPWSRSEVRNQLAKCRAVFLPTGAKLGKSANRAVTAIRRGRFVVTGDMPAYAEIPGIWVGNVREGLDYAMGQDTRNRIAIAQSYVRQRFNPETIARHWQTLLTSLAS